VSGLRLLVLHVVVAACGGKPAVAPPTIAAKPACTEVVAVTVPEEDVRVGDRRRYEVEVEIEWDEGGAKRNAVIRSVTDEKVLAVADGRATEREIVFVDHVTAAVPKLEYKNLEGRRFVATTGSPTRFTENGAPVPEELMISLLSASASTDATNVIQGRTFQRDVMTQLGYESGEDSAGKPKAHVVILREVKGTIAKFEVGTKLMNGIETNLFDSYDLARGVQVGTEGTTTFNIGGTDLSFTAVDKMTYPDRPARDVPTRACADEVVTLPWLPPRVGETFSVMQTYKAAGANGEVLTITTESKEKVLAVSDGTIADLEAKVHQVGPTGPRDFTLRSTWDGTSFRFLVDGQTMTKPELAARGDVGMRPWFPRIATDRTYRIGVEQRSQTEIAPLLGGSERVDIRSTLVEKTATRAMFRVQIHAKLQHEGKAHQGVYRGTAEYDLVRGRAIAISLAIDSDEIDGLQAQAWEQRFTYD